MSSPASSSSTNNNNNQLLKLTSSYSPSPIPATKQSVAYALAKLQASALPTTTATSGDNKDAASNNKDPATTNKPIHVSIAIDCSGSMSGERIKEAKEAVDFIADQLRPVDYLGIIAFSSGVQVTLAKTKMDAQGKTLAHQAVNRLHASGSTFLSGGLFAAIAQVCDEPITHGPGSDQPTPVPFPNNNSRRAMPMPPNFGNNNVNTIPPHPSMIANAAYPFTTPDMSNIGPNSINFFVNPAEASASATPSITVEVSHTYNGNGNKPEEKHQYKLKLNAPEDKISQFTIHDPENRFSDILGSGETECELKPVAAPIQKLEITFDLVSDNNNKDEDNNQKRQHKVNYFLGETPSGNKKITIPIPSSGSNKPTEDGNKNKTVNSDDAIYCCYVLSDGHANAGLRDAASMNAALQQRLAAASKNVTIHTFGLGTNHNAKMLEEIASASEGSFYFIENNDQIAEIFADVLGGVFSVMAMNVRLTARLKAGNGVRFAEPMTKFKTKIEDDGNTIVITMKDIYAEETRDILLSLKVDGTTAKAAQVDAPVSVDWTLEYADAVNKTSGVVTLTNATVLNISSDSEPVVDNEIDMQIQRYKSIQVMNEVRTKADRGDLGGAQALAKGYYQELQAAPSAAMPTSIAIQQQMLDLDNLASSATQWNNVGSKKSVAYSQAHAQQRSNDVSETACNAYAGNFMKMEMRKKAKESRRS